MGLAVFKTVARPASWSRVGSTPMHLRQSAIELKTQTFVLGFAFGRRRWRGHYGCRVTYTPGDKNGCSSLLDVIAARPGGMSTGKAATVAKVVCCSWTLSKVGVSLSSGPICGSGNVVGLPNNYEQNRQSGSRG